MILGLKSRWTELMVNQIINLSSHVELHTELDDVNELFTQQVLFLKGLEKTFHVHAPFRIDGRYVDFVKDFDVFKKCVMLGDCINKGSYHLICHCINPDYDAIKHNIKLLLKESSKAVLCFENLHSQNNSLPDDFIELFKNEKSKRVGLCIDVCHAFLNGPNVFDGFIDALKSRVIHAHIADVGAGGIHGVQIGEGIIDFGHVFKRLNECIPGLVVIPEVTNSHLNGNSGLISALERIRKYL